MEEQTTETITETATETSQEQPTQSQAPTGDYAPRVDLEGLPEDIRGPVEARLAHMSRMIKKAEARGDKTASQYRDIAAEQSRIIEELQGGMGAVVDHLQTQTFAQTETQLKAQLRQARDSGDTEGEFDLIDKLAELKAQKLSAPKLQPKQKNETRQQAFAGTPSAMQIADDGVAEGDITHEDLQVVNAWSQEKSNGQHLRPWTENRGSEQNPDPQYLAGLMEARAIWASPRFAETTVEQKLAELDRRMGTQKQTNGQTVIGGGFTPRSKSSTVRMTPNQERVATKTKFAGPGKSDADHIAAYRKQIEKVNASKGAR